ncbi:MAG: hypothetical protein CK425_09985 [Parachlamydia sp.]|nr:MAG: hypothetical protein CK425_09985 [Parachlamydia sp.]
MKINPNPSAKSPQEFPHIPCKPPAKLDILDAIKESEASIGSFVMGFISSECLTKLQNNDAVRIEIEITTSFIEFTEAVEDKTAVIIRTTADGKPKFEFSSEMYRLLEANDIEEFALTSDGATVVFKKDEVETAKYTVSDINAFVLLFFSDLSSKSSSATPSASNSLQKPAYPLRNRSEQLFSSTKAKKPSQAQQLNKRAKQLQKTAAFFRDQMEFNIKFRRNLEKLEKAEKASQENAAYMKDKAEELSQTLRNRNISVEHPLPLRQRA